MISSRTAAALYLVGTPIGNLGDITIRARDALASSEIILAEDTRRARSLLQALGISANKKIFRLDAHTTASQTEKIVERLKDGSSACVITDAGMPGISDPGAEIVRACRSAGVTMEVLPGPSAVTTAVALSGLVDSGFSFLGFPPAKQEKLRRFQAELRDSRLPTVFFESPRRIQDTLVALAEIMPEREICICRELTKLHEEVLRGTVAELLADSQKSEREWLGELTIVCAASDGEPVIWDKERLLAELQRCFENGQGVKQASKALALVSGWSARDIYSLADTSKA